MKELAVTLCLVTVGGVFTQGEAVTALTGSAVTLWVLVAAALVFFMQAGFAFVEARSQSSEDVVNIFSSPLTGDAYTGTFTEPDVTGHGTKAYASGDTLRDPILVSQTAGD